MIVNYIFQQIILKMKQKFIFSLRKKTNRKDYECPCTSFWLNWHFKKIFWDFRALFEFFRPWRAFLSHLWIWCYKCKHHHGLSEPHFVCKNTALAIWSPTREFCWDLPWVRIEIDFTAIWKFIFSSHWMKIPLLNLVLMRQFNLLLSCKHSGERLLLISVEGWQEAFWWLW